MEFDAFDEGIELGGLRNRDEIRLLICYILRAVDAPISKRNLNDSMLQDGLANYFEINQAISELLKNGTIDMDIDENGEELLTATEKGKDIADTLETSLPKTVREKAVNSAIKLMTLAKTMRENKIETVSAPDGGYYVTFSLMNGDEALMKLTIFVADSMQLEAVKNNFLNDPVKLYSSIITALTI